jgi:formylglycine-generating enzyme required for sulfatase activity
MHGNAWEWCQDRENDTRAKDKEDIVGSQNQESRVLRGGSFSVQASNVRSAHRSYIAPANRVSNFGFRPARTFTAE